MHLLDGEVGGHQQLMSGRNAEHGAVVADTCNQRFASAGLTLKGSAPDLFD
jgi:hypothetical protein